MTDTQGQTTTMGLPPKAFESSIETSITSKIAVASSVEWRFHLGEKLGINATYWIGAPLLLFTCGSIYVAVCLGREMRSVYPAGIPWHTVPVDDRWELALTFAAVGLLPVILVILDFIFLRILRISLAIRYRRLRNAVAENITNGFAQADEKPIDQLVAASCTGLALLVATIFPAYMKDAIATMLQTEPLAAQVAVSLALVVIVTIALYQVLTKGETVSAAAFALASAVPRLRRARFQSIPPKDCLVCTGERRERPILLRGWRQATSASRPRLLNIKRKLSNRFEWPAYLIQHWRTDGLIVMGMAWLSVINLCGIPLVEGTSFTILAGMLVVLTFVIGDVKTMLNPFGVSKERLLGLFAILAGSLFILFNLNTITRLTDWTERTATAFSMSHDRNLTMAFYIVLEGALLYDVYSIWAKRRGRLTRWTPLQVVRGMTLVLASLAVGALQGDWYPTMIVLSLGWLSSKSLPWRQHWREARRERPTTEDYSI